MTRRSTASVALAASALLGAAGGAAAYSAFASRPTKSVRQVIVRNAQPAAATTTLSVNEIYRRAYKGVVELTVATNQSSPTPFGGSQPQRAQGSGFVYDGNGDIVTNEHVVSGSQSISVKFWNGATYKAHLVGSDASTDLAIVKVDAPASLLSPLALGDSGALAIGDGLVAIGSPFGLPETVTSGIVSALHRQISSPNNFTIDNAIQTDAPINHGNSGGPLLDVKGRVVGVNAQIVSDSGGNDGVGFAIPSETVKPIVSQLLASGKVEHAYLGVSVETIPSSAAAALGLPAGAEVVQVAPGTAAATAGLHAASGSRTVAGQAYPTGGDVITAIDGKPISTAGDLRSAINAKRAGSSVSVTFVRAGKTRTVLAKLSTRPS